MGLHGLSTFIYEGLKLRGGDFTTCAEDFCRISDLLVLRSSKVSDVRVHLNWKVVPSDPPAPSGCGPVVVRRPLPSSLSCLSLLVSV